MKKLIALFLVALMLFSVAAADGLTVGHKLGKPHGAQSFAEVTVVLQDGVIAVVYLDEYQFMDAATEGVVPVPNSDGTFGSNVVEGKVLTSKRESTAPYSANMTDHAGATVTIDANYDAIQAFAVGKTVEELKAAVEGKEAAEVIDAVSGATLVDTQGYLLLIIEAAEAAK